MKLREIILCGLFIALVAVGAFVRIPVGTDVYTLQFLFTLLAGLVLGARLGALAIGTYVLMGLVGIPLFASGGGPSGVVFRLPRNRTLTIFALFPRVIPVPG